MEKALEVAQKGYENYEVAVGCVFAQVQEDKQYKILVEAHNLTNKTQNATQHCEIISIGKLNDMGYQNGNELTLYVTCEPCIMCAYALGIFGIKEVYYGCGNDKFGGNGSVLKLNSQNYGINPYPSYSGFMEIECQEILKKFYERGNQNLEEDKRHRRQKKQIDQQKQ